jgi:hypothetical protein
MLVARKTAGNILAYRCGELVGRAAVVFAQIGKSERLKPAIVVNASTNRRIVSSMNGILRRVDAFRSEQARYSLSFRSRHLSMRHFGGRGSDFHAVPSRTKPARVMAIDPAYMPLVTYQSSAVTPFLPT